MGQWRALVDVPASATAALPMCRGVTAAVLEGWALASISGDAQLVVSELVGNAIRHAPGSETYELEFVRRARGVRIYLADGSSIRPVVRELAEASQGGGGRGMRIVDVLSSAWGCEDHRGGKRVWVDLDQPSAEPPQLIVVGPAS